MLLVVGLRGLQFIVAEILAPASRLFSGILDCFFWFLGLCSITVKLNKYILFPSGH